LQTKSHPGVLSDNSQKINVLRRITTCRGQNFLIMYAIVEIAGQQFKVEKDKKIFVHRLKNNEGDKLEFEKVLLVEDEGSVKFGTPVLEGAKISAKVIEHVRGKKVQVFKKKRRKGYQKLNGHRQDFTRIEIESITF
jgi:large subunit ribosomal protein L21